jgi:hypothetical protein
MSPLKWLNATNALGFWVKSGRYGGTYAHKDIAFKFASWISVEFELYLIKEFQRLKEDEKNKLAGLLNESWQNLIITFIQMPLSKI